FRLCPFSRAARLALAELDIEPELIEERSWEWRQEFLALNPAGELPVLQIEDAAPLCGIYAISEYLGEAPAKSRAAAGAPPDSEAVMEEIEETEAPRLRLFPGDPAQRAEVRRLAEWFNGKFNREVTHPLLEERV